MINHMGSKTAIMILEWMRDRTFTRAKLGEHLEGIGFADPYAKASLQSPLERIMQSIKRNGYASYSNGAWHANNSTIDHAIDFHQKMPSEEAEVSLQRITEEAQNIFGSLATQEAIENAITQHGIDRRSKQHKNDTPKDGPKMEEDAMSKESKPDPVLTGPWHDDGMFMEFSFYKVTDALRDPYSSGYNLIGAGGKYPLDPELEEDEENDADQELEPSVALYLQELDTGDDMKLNLTPDSARLLAERLNEWADDAETNQQTTDEVIEELRMEWYKSEPFKPGTTQA